LISLIIVLFKTLHAFIATATRFAETNKIAKLILANSLSKWHRIPQVFFSENIDIPNWFNIFIAARSGAGIAPSPPCLGPTCLGLGQE
jgi:hypothetical protein